MFNNVVLINYSSYISVGPIVTTHDQLLYNTTTVSNVYESMTDHNIKVIGSVLN